tara:strand:- start:4172 stop:4783 length:612 start_codon:yes stop_codon:yes gene_type:complete
MIKILDSKAPAIEGPVLRVYELYKESLKKNQKFADAGCLATYNPRKGKVSSRFVNIKYISNNSFIFFSNYNSQKALDINLFNNVALNFFWSTLNIQIRIEGEISKCNDLFSDEHFLQRTDKKNALAISSSQSSIITNFDKVIKNYTNVLNSTINLKKRPSYWGGYLIKPKYIEIWSGEQNRLNKREVFELDKNKRWISYFLEP